MADALGQLILGEDTASKGPNLDLLHPVLYGQIQAANKAYREQYGADLPITSGARTREEQQSLVDRAARGEPNIFMPTNPAKEPNRQSYHENAVDISTNIPPEFAARMESEFGLHRPYGAKDPVHWEVHPEFKSVTKEQTDAYAPADKAITTAQAAEPSLGDLILGGTELHEPKAAAPQAAAPSAEQPTVAPTAPVIAAPTAASVVSPEPRSFKDYVKETGKSVASFLDNTIGGLIPAAVGVVAHPLLKVVETTALATGGKFNAAEATHAIVDPISRPFAKAVGIDPEDPAYKRESVNRFMTWIGEHIGEGSQVLSDKFYEQTGVRIPVSDFEYAANLGLAAVTGKTAPVAVKGVKGAIGALEEQFAAKQQPAPRFEPRLEPTAEQLTPQEPAAAGNLQQQFAQKKMEQMPVTAAANEPVVTAEPITAAAAPVEGRELKGVGAAKAEHNPYTPFVNEEHARGGDFPMVKLSNGSRDVPAPEQQTRAQIAREILGTDQVRTGVVTGNENTLRNEVTLAKKPEQTLEGQLLKDQISVEQQALSKYARNIIRDTGADEVLANNYERGERINHAAVGEEGIGGFLKSEKQRIYEQARQQVGDNPVEASNLKRIINSPQFEAELKLKGIKDFTSGMNDLIQMHETAGFEGRAPGSIAGLEELRQSLNRGWTPQNSHFVGRVIRAIDNDIAAAGGPGLYEQARNLHAAEKTLFGSKGIKTLFGEIDPNGVQTATSFDQITQKLNSMPFDEWRHVFDTFDRISRGTITEKGVTLNIPKELQQAAESAKREILGSLAREVYEQGAQNAGVWNYNAANKTMNARSKKMEYAFDPETLKKMHTLNYGGHIMPGMHGYEGAALQTERVKGLGSRLLELPIKAAKGMAERVPVLGGAVPAVSETLSQTARTRALNRAALEAQRKMRENAKLGTKLSDIGKE